MKKIILMVFIVIIAFIILFFAINSLNSPESPEINNVPEEQNIDHLKLLENANINIPDLEVTTKLKNGGTQFEVPFNGTSFIGSIVLQKDFWVEWSNEDRKDLSGIYAINTGGSGVFLYLILFDVSNDGTLSQKAETFLGDRISIESLRVDKSAQNSTIDYAIVIDTLVRGEDDSFAALPTVPEIKTFYVIDQRLAR
ncbi:MAG: hypothetical protein JW740_02240 [Candidatus Zambryskibacteria bacterium]|nr:hypothetical protein [Candidatus Zambryskibacteria bacterium]